MNRKFLYIALALLLPLTSLAQRRHTVKKAATQVSSASQQLYQSMLPATAKVMFIDSVVVGKYDFLRHVPLNEESGTLTVKSDRFGRAMMPLTQHENEFHDRRVFAEGDTASTSLYTQTLLGDTWSQPAVIAEVDSHDYEWPDFPFLASDGVTLYFSAKGPNSMGGRDIFMTTFDSDKGQWYEPQNVGLPFNSTANDYLLAYDDLDTLGWLVTDRRQPADSVCIYTFVPTPTRLDFQNDDLSNAQLSRFANISSIRDTWTFGDRKAALQRLTEMVSRGKERRQTSTMHFVVNDRTVITSPAQFRQEESRSLYGQLQELKGMQSQTEQDLESKRGSYAQSPAKRKTLSADILRLEKEQEQQRSDMQMLVKKIRKLENE